MPGSGFGVDSLIYAIFRGSEPQVSLKARPPLSLNLGWGGPESEMCAPERSSRHRKRREARGRHICPDMEQICLEAKARFWLWLALAIWTESGFGFQARFWPRREGKSAPCLGGGGPESEMCAPERSRRLRRGREARGCHITRASPSVFGWLGQGFIAIIIID